MGCWYCVLPPKKRTRNSRFSLVLPDKSVADLIGVEPSTLFRWKQRPAFANAIKSAVAARQLGRLRKVENAEPGWQSACWALERHLPERFARPEVQIPISNQQQVNIRGGSEAPRFGGHGSSK
jgi:hypothetical protein